MEGFSMVCKDLISVIMATRNTPEAYLRRAINSILKQSYDNIELIIVVDGAEDDFDIVNSIDDKRIKIIKNSKSIGLAACLNKAFLTARGKYIARMDSDDISLPNRLKEQYSFMEKNKNVDICSTFAKEFGVRNNIMLLPFFDDGHIKAELFFGNVLVHPSIMFRASFLKKNQIKYNEKFECSQDYELWTRVKNVCTFAIVPNVLLLYRTHSKQISTQRKEKQREYKDRCLLRNMEETYGWNDKRYTNYIKILNGEKLKYDLEDLQTFVSNCSKENKRLHNDALTRALHRRFAVLLIRDGAWSSSLSRTIMALSWLNYSFYFRKSVLLIWWRIRTKVISLWGE